MCFFYPATEWTRDLFRDKGFDPYPCWSLASSGQGLTLNTYSTPNSEWPVVAEYESGQVIEMDTVVVYFHWVSVIKPGARVYLQYVAPTTY